MKSHRRIALSRGREQLERNRLNWRSSDANDTFTPSSLSIFYLLCCNAFVVILTPLNIEKIVVKRKIFNANILQMQIDCALNLCDSYSRVNHPRFTIAD